MVGLGVRSKVNRLCLNRVRVASREICRLAERMAIGMGGTAAMSSQNSCGTPHSCSPFSCSLSPSSFSSSSFSSSSLGFSVACVALQAFA